MCRGSPNAGSVLDFPTWRAKREYGYFDEITCWRLRLVGGHGVPGFTTILDSMVVIVKGGSLRTSMFAAGVDIHGSEGSISVIASDSIGVGRTNDIGVVQLKVHLTSGEHGACAGIREW